MNKQLAQLLMGLLLIGFVGSTSFAYDEGSPEVGASSVEEADDDSNSTYPTTYEDEGDSSSDESYEASDEE
tara:strand:+ start:381 stop:593 length:213 start_codon:yes stop_codon:yes gene_type:complete